MTNKPTKYRDIFGWFNYETTYDMIFNHLKDGDIFVEVGVFEGKSLCYMGELSIKNNKLLYLSGVDIFRGCDDWLAKYGIKEKGLGTYERAIANLAPIAEKANIRLYKDTSYAASERIPDELAAVFIDAAHDYASVKDDISFWLPKVKTGGILAGHDYGGDWTGVKQAVDESLSDYEIHTNLVETTWWIYKKGGE